MHIAYCVLRIPCSLFRVPVPLAKHSPAPPLLLSSAPPLLLSPVGAPPHPRSAAPTRTPATASPDRQGPRARCRPARGTGTPPGVVRRCRWAEKPEEKPAWCGRTRTPRPALHGRRRRAGRAGSARTRNCAACRQDPRAGRPAERVDARAIRIKGCGEVGGPGKRVRHPDDEPFIGMDLLVLFQSSPAKRRIAAPRRRAAINAREMSLPAPRRWPGEGSRIRFTPHSIGDSKTPGAGAGSTTGADVCALGPPRDPRRRDPRPRRS